MLAGGKTLGVEFRYQGNDLPETPQFAAVGDFIPA
jgi:hypothetical protein